MNPYSAKPLSKNLFSPARGRTEDIKKHSPQPATHPELPRVIACLFQKIYDYGIALTAGVTVAAVHYKRPASFFENVVMKSIDYRSALVNRGMGAEPGKER